MDKQYLIDRLKERSTWLGIIALLTACGAPIAPESIDHIVTVGLALAGLVGIFTADKT